MQDEIKNGYHTKYLWDYLLEFYGNKEEALEQYLIMLEDKCLQKNKKGL